MSNRFFIAVMLIIAAAFTFFVVVSKNGDEASQNNSASSQGTNHTLGQGKKNVTLLEYGDFQCPACRSYQPIIKEVVKKYDEEITFQFRHFPLVQIHPNAFTASRAAEAAGKQGKFFEMHDLLFESQDSWGQASDPTNQYVALAQQLNLNVEQFRTDLASSEVNDLINADIRLGQAAEATSTPTFLINDKKIESNPRSIDDFSKLIDEAIAASSQN